MVFFACLIAIANRRKAGVGLDDQFHIVLDINTSHTSFALKQGNGHRQHSGNC